MKIKHVIFFYLGLSSNWDNGATKTAKATKAASLKNDLWALGFALCFSSLKPTQKVFSFLDKPDGINIFSFTKQGKAGLKDSRAITAK